MAFNCSISKVYDVYVYSSDKGANIIGAKGVYGKKTDDILNALLGIKYFR